MPSPSRRCAGRRSSRPACSSLGFSTVFVALGASASVFGSLIRAYADKLAMVAGVAIIIMGLHFLGVTRLALLYREKRMTVPKPVGLWGAYVMGLAFAFGWTPCIGPILAVILAVAASEATVAKGAGLLAVYSLGLGIPFIAAAFAVEPFAKFLARFRELSAVGRARRWARSRAHRHRVPHRLRQRGELLAARDVSGAWPDRLVGRLRPIRDRAARGFPCLGKIQHAMIVEAAADDLHADRQAGLRERRIDRDRRLLGEIPRHREADVLERVLGIVARARRARPERPGSARSARSDSRSCRTAAPRGGAAPWSG